jgi:hypothetical protein
MGYLAKMEQIGQKRTMTFTVGLDGAKPISEGG